MIRLNFQMALNIPKDYVVATDFKGLQRIGLKISGNAKPLKN